jgi:hypothetical protein
MSNQVLEGWKVFRRICGHLVPATAHISDMLPFAEKGWNERPAVDRHGIPTNFGPMTVFTKFESAQHFADMLRVAAVRFSCLAPPEFVLAHVYYEPSEEDSVYIGTEHLRVQCKLTQLCESNKRLGVTMDAVALCNGFEIIKEIPCDKLQK